MAGNFDDSMMRGHMDMRSHLDDLAQRHPEFAEHLRWPPCSGDVRSNTWGRKRRGSGEDVGEASTKQQQQQQPQQHENTNFEQEKTEEPGPLRGRPKENLRNTVPDMGQKQQDTDENEKEGRGQRSWSAPPDNRTQQPQDKPQRYVSKIEITPVNPAASQDQQPSASSAPPSTGDAAKPPMAPKQQQQQQHNQPQHKQSTIRHIPIYVEGRDEPILPKNVEQEFTQSQAPPASYHHPQYTSHHQFQQQQAPPPPPPPPPQPQKHEPKPQPQKQEPKHQPQKQQHQPKQEEPPVNPNDPISRVQNIQKEVNELQAKIENFKGSRTDKEYIYLDEMLTRNLLKLDDIDTEGKDNVRSARKEAIKTIQRCISVLEGNAPVQDKGNKGEMADKVQQNTSDPVQSVTKDEKMDTAPATTDTPAPEQQQNNENKMEIDNTNKSQSDSKTAESASNTDKKQESENKVPSNTEGSKMEVDSQPNNAAETQEKKQDSPSTAPAPSS